MMFTTNSHRFWGSSAAAAVLLLACLAPVKADAPQASIDRAHAVLRMRATGTDVLSLMHFGQKYRSHSYTRTLNVNNRPDNFALEYHYEWGDDGKTDVAFLCDRGGTVYKVQVLRSNATFNQPFTIAELTIEVAGNFILDALGDNMKAEDKAKIREAINNPNAKKILEVYLGCKTL